jgi:hypothetical protein
MPERLEEPSNHPHGTSRNLTEIWTAQASRTKLHRRSLFGDDWADDDDIPDDFDFCNGTAGISRMFSGGRQDRHYDSEQAFDLAIGIINIQQDYKDLYDSKENWCATIPAFARFLRNQKDLSHFRFPGDQQGEDLRQCLEKLSTKIYGEFPAPLEILAALNIQFLSELPERASILAQFHAYLCTGGSQPDRSAFSDDCLAGRVSTTNIRYQDPTTLPGFKRLFDPNEWIRLSMDLTNYVTARTIHELDAEAATASTALRTFKYPTSWKADRMAAHEDGLFGQYAAKATAAGLTAIDEVERSAIFKSNLSDVYKQWINAQQLKKGVGRLKCTREWIVGRVRELQQRTPTLLTAQHSPRIAQPQQQQQIQQQPQAVTQQKLARPGDLQIKCKDCEAIFTFDEGEQQFYKQKGLQQQPVRCKDCRTKNRTVKFDTPCRQFAAGDCRFGDKCKFQHPGSDIDTANVVMDPYNDPESIIEVFNWGEEDQYEDPW